MPDDTLQQRAKKFAENHIFSADEVPGATEVISVHQLKLEIRFARENSPYEPLTGGELGEVFSGGLKIGWQSFADHLRDCLGEK